MIEFCGIYSDKCRNYIRKSTVKNLCFRVLAVVFAFSVPIIIAGIIWGILYIAIPIISVICIFGAVYLFDSIKTARSRVFAKIVIQGGVIDLYCERSYSGSPSRASGSVNKWEKNRQLDPVVRKTGKFRFQTTVAVEYGNMGIDYENPYQSSLVSQVKKIVDMGEWYRLVFYSGKSSCFVCQKDLLVCGTLEEFEGLFEGKLEKNTKKAAKQKK